MRRAPERWLASLYRVGSCCSRCWRPLCRLQVLMREAKQVRLSTLVPATVMAIGVYSGNYLPLLPHTLSRRIVDARQNAT